MQCGEAGHWHPPLNGDGVINLVGKTTLREFVRLVHHAEGVVCPVTLAMHLAAAVETPLGRPRNRPCVVIAGGREPPSWEAYSFHQFLSSVGMLTCCAEGGCWKSRCQLVGDGDEKDRRNLCEQPVEVSPGLVIPRCQEMISADDVIRRIEMYLSGDLIGRLTVPVTASVQPSFFGAGDVSPLVVRPRVAVLIEFKHGLGDAMQLTRVLRHLRQEHPDWDIDVAALRGKHSAFAGLCRRTLVLAEDVIRRRDYQLRYRLAWHESRSNDGGCPNTKATRCLRDVFQLVPQPELCRYEIRVNDATRQKARDYLQSLCGLPADTGRFRAVLIHYEGNTSTELKNLPHALMQQVCDVVLRAGYVPVIFDWDRRSPLPDGVRIHCPDGGHALWHGTETGDAALIAALIEASTLMIGIDSGPLHVAGATSTPTLAVWTRHHPVHFFDLADNVEHLVPEDHATLAAGVVGATYFENHYRHRTYQSLQAELPAEVERRLTGCDGFAAGKEV